MTQMSTEPVLQWVLDTVGVGAKLVAAKGLRGGSSPWLLGIERGGSTHEVVLRVAGGIPPAGIATGAAALQVAEQYGLAAPRLIASDLDGQTIGVAATLETALHGSSTAPEKVSTERLREAGATIAKVHANPREPQRDLPLRTRPIQADDHAMDRRWVTLYRASAGSERPAIVDALSELTGWDTDRARRAMTGDADDSSGRLWSTHSTALLHYADERVRAVDRQRVQTVFVHGDVWVGNMVWTGDRCAGLIDWKTAGVGDPGIDLGAMRLDVALQYGQSAPRYVLDGWQREAGRQAISVAYWDAVAALNTPTELGEWSPGFDEQGKPLDESAVTARRDAFLRDALDRLD